MSSIQLLRMLRGYVKFYLRSGSLERFLNLCAHHGIPTWGCRKQDGTVSGYTTVSGYRRMRPIARKAGVSLRLKERQGLPFVVYRYRKRVGILVGVLLFAAILLGTRQFIWVVQVEGCQQLEQQILYNALEELGVKRGTLKNRIDPKLIQQQITLKVSDLSWATLNLKGTTVTLLVRERTPPPPKVDTTMPANVVAAQDGQIKRLEVTDGRAVLRVGDTVRAGEVIVSGINEDRWGLTHLVRANATVIAHMPQTLTVQVPFQQETVRLTGERIKRNYLEIMGIRAPLFLYSGLEGEYKLERTNHTPALFGKSMPFSITREAYIFYEYEKQTVSPETALQLAKQQLARLERASWKEGTILRSDYSATTEGDVITLTGEYLVEMDIAKQVEIPVFDKKLQEKAKKPREGGY